MKATLFKSWKTTVLGLVSFGASIYMFVKGHPWSEVSGAALVGIGLILSKDGNVSGIGPTNG